MPDPFRGSPFPEKTRTLNGTPIEVLSQVIFFGSCESPSRISVLVFVTAVHVMKYPILATVPRKEGGRPGGRQTRTGNSFTSPGATSTLFATEIVWDRATYRSPGASRVFVLLGGPPGDGLTQTGSKRSTPCQVNSIDRTRTGPAEVQARTRTEKSLPGVTASTPRSTHCNSRGGTFPATTAIAPISCFRVNARPPPQGTAFVAAKHRGETPRSALGDEE